MTEQAAGAPATPISPETNAIKFVVVPGQPLVIDCTSMSDFKTCHRYAYLRSVLGLSPTSTKPALSFGGAIHEALYVWNILGDRRAAIDSFITAAKAADLVLDGDKRSITNGMFILDSYFKKWDSERKKEKRIGGEVFFRLPLPGIDNVIVVGKIDYIFEIDGRIRARDHKTASSIGSNYHFSINPSLQNGIYSWAAETIIGQRLEMFDFDVLLVAKEKREEVRFPIMRSQFGIDSCLEDMRVGARDIIAKMFSGEWDRNLKSCGNYGGCQYHPICTTTNPQPVIKSMFTVEYWNPNAD